MKLNSMNLFFVKNLKRWYKLRKNSNYSVPKCTKKMKTKTKTTHTHKQSMHYENNNNKKTTNCDESIIMNISIPSNLERRELKDKQQTKTTNLLTASVCQ